MADHNENGVNTDHKIRTTYVGCSGCNQPFLPSMVNPQQPPTVADNRRRLADREHIHQMETLKLEAGKVIKSMQAKMSAFDKNVKEINANGQRFAQSTLVSQECDTRSCSDCNFEMGVEEALQYAGERGEPKRTKEIKNQDDEHELNLLNSRLGSTESDVSAKVDGWEDSSERVENLEERNAIFLETKQDHQDIVEKLESKSYELEVLYKRLLKTEVDLSAKRDEVQDLSNKLKLMESQGDIIENQKRLLQSKEEQIRKIENKLWDSEKRLAKALGKVEEQGHELEKNLVKRYELDQRIEKAEAMAQDAEILSEKIYLLEQQNEKLKQSKKDLESKQGRFESRDAQLHTLENQLQEREDMLVEVSRKIDEQRQELESSLAELSKMDERRAKAEATAEELMRTPLLTLCSNIVTDEYPKSGRNWLICNSLNRERKLRGLPSTSTSRGASVSDISELEEISKTINSDLEESESEPSQIFRCVDFSHVPYYREQKGHNPSNVHFSSAGNFGNTIPSSVDQQATQNNLSFPKGSTTGKGRCFSTSSLDEQTHSKTRRYISALNFSQDESFSQSKMTCIKISSSDTSLSGSLINPGIDPSNSQKLEKNMRMKAKTSSSVKMLKEEELSRRSGRTTERQLKLNTKISTQEEEFNGKGTSLKKSQQLKKCVITPAKYMSTSKSITQPATPSADTDTFSIDVMSSQEDNLEDSMQKLEKELSRMNVQLACEREKFWNLEVKYEKRCQAIAKLINKVSQLRKKLVERDGLIESYSEKASEKSKENVLGAVGIMENGLNKLFDCFKICCLDIGHMVQELQKRTVDLKYYVAERSWEGFFQEYSLKSIPIKNCITGINKNFLKHQEEMYRFNRNFKDALAIILRLYRFKAMSGHARSSPESCSSRVITSSLQYHCQQSSLSSVKTPSRKRSSSYLNQKKRTSQPQRRDIVKNELKHFDIEKSATFQETSHSATSSIFATFTSGSERAPKVKKRYKLKKHFKRSKSESKEKSFSAERIHSEGQVDMTPKIRDVAMKKFDGGDARVFKDENNHMKPRSKKRNRKQTIPGAASSQRRRHKAKTLKKLKQSRSSTLRNALLEGLGYLTSPSK